LYFVPNFMGRFLGETEDQVRASLRSVEGCGSNRQKNSVNRRLFTFYTSNSRCGKLPSVGDKKKQISLSRGVVLSQSIFHPVVFSFLLYCSVFSACKYTISYRIVSYNIRVAGSGIWCGIRWLINNNNNKGVALPLCEAKTISQTAKETPLSQSVAETY